MVDENVFIEKYGMVEFVKWYFGEDMYEIEGIKGWLKFLYGDFCRVYWCVVIFGESCVGQYDYMLIENVFCGFFVDIDGDWL